MDYQVLLFNLCDLVVLNGVGSNEELFAKCLMEMGEPTFSAVNLLKDRGNVLFKEGNISVASLHYMSALKFLCFLGLPPSSEQPMASSLAFSLILNLAFCELKLLNYTKALVFCNFVLAFEPCNVKALYRRGLAFKNMNSFSKALADFESALHFDPSNKDVNRELLSLVDRLALNLNGKRFALQFDPLAINKRGKIHVSSPEVADKCVSPLEAGDNSCSASKLVPSDLGSANVVNGISTSFEVMECMDENYPSFAVEADGSNDSTPSSDSSSKHAQFVFTNKKQAHKRLRLSSHAYNKLMLGDNIEFFHPRSGAVLRVRPLTPKTSIQPGTLHDDMPWEAAVPTSNPLPDISLPKEATIPLTEDCHLQNDFGSMKEALTQEECFVQMDKKKRLSSETSYASKVSIVQFKFEAVRAHSNEQGCHKGIPSIARGQVARPTVNLKKRTSVSVTRLSSFCRYTKAYIAVRKTKRRDDYLVQFDDYYPPFKKRCLAFSLWSNSEFSSLTWMSSGLARPFENG